LPLYPRAELFGGLPGAHHSYGFVRDGLVWGTFIHVEMGDYLRSIHKQYYGDFLQKGTNMGDTVGDHTWRSFPGLQHSGSIWMRSFDKVE
jgi:hypothetical protein